MPITQLGGLTAAEGVLKFQVYTWYNGQIGINTYFFRYLLGGQPPERLGTLALAFTAAIDDEYFDLIGQSVQLLGVKATDFFNDLDPLPGINVDGRESQDGALPITTGVCGLIKWTTAKQGRSFRGRTYLPFPRQTDVSSLGTISANYVAKSDALISVFRFPDGLITGGSIYSLFHGVYSQKLGAMTNVQTGRIENVVATQRRRSPRGRLNPPIIT